MSTLGGCGRRTEREMSPLETGGKVCKLLDVWPELGACCCREDAVKMSGDLGPEAPNTLDSLVLPIDVKAVSRWYCRNRGLNSSGISLRCVSRGG